MPRVVHFEFPANNPEKLVHFYRNVFNWTIENWGGPVDWLITTGPEEEPGINGAIARKQDTVTNAPIVTISVPSVEEFLIRVQSAGGRAAGPKRVIPGVGYHAYCQDPEGTYFVILENDSSAK